MRFAFSLMELIFVLVLIGILVGVGSSSYRSDRALIDARYVALQIDKVRYRAIGFDHRNFSGGFDSVESIGCIDLKKESFEQNTSAAKMGGVHPSTDISSPSGMSGTRLCFDSDGKPHDGNFTVQSILHSKAELNITNSGSWWMVEVMPISGYVIINRR